MKVNVGYKDSTQTQAVMDDVSNLVNIESIIDFTGNAHELIPLDLMMRTMKNQTVAKLFCLLIVQVLASCRCSGIFGAYSLYGLFRNT
jgi:hypothetical protein